MKKQNAFTFAEVKKMFPRPFEERVRVRGYNGAFTLAEVLITLGVIGVVAAMTLPTLIKDYQKKAWATQLQKTYSILEQGFQKMMADEGVTKLSHTSVWAKLENSEHGECVTYMYNNDEGCKEFFDEFKKYFNILGFEKYGSRVYYLNGDGDFDGSDDIVMTLADGTMVYLYLLQPWSYGVSCETIKSLGGNLCKAVSFSLYFDINGRKGPNKDGRDIFYFVLSDDGKLYPVGGKDSSLFNSGDLRSYWRNNANECGEPGKTADNSSGFSCAARIIENGWKMDY